MRQVFAGFIALLSVGVLVIGCGGSDESDVSSALTGLDTGAIAAPGTTCPPGYTLQGDICANAAGEQVAPTPAATPGTEFTGAGEATQAGGETAASEEGTDNEETATEEEVEASLDETCADGSDEDGDGLIDCDDPDCADDMACGGGTGGTGGTGGGGAGTGSPLSCSGVLDCVQSCGQDEACAGACIEQSSAEAQALLQSLFACIESCPAEQSDEECVSVTCGAQAQACIADTGTGSGGGSGGGSTAGISCGGILQCFQGCGQTDQACLQACVAQGDAEAQQQFMAFNTCITNNCADATEATAQQCISDNCSAELDACMSGTGGGAVGGGGGGSTATGDPCSEGLSYEGCCNGDTLQWCEGEQLNEIQCQGGCGVWNDAQGFYDCFQDGDTAPVADPSGTHPIECQ